MKHTLENSWCEINFERLIIYIYTHLYTVFFNYSRRLNRWVVSSVNRPPRFCIVNFHFLWTSYVQKKKKKLARGFDIKLFSQMCFSFMEWIRWSTWKNCVGSKRIFVNSLRYLLQRVVINVKFIKRWPRWNPSNYRAIKLTIPWKFFTNLEIQNSIDLKYLRYL